MKIALAGSALALSAVLLLGAAEPPADGALAPLDEASAARAPEATLEGGTAARPPRRFDIKYPEKALNRGEEGWVTLSFVVTPEGKVSDPIVEDSNGIPEFEKEALRVISRAQYQPATWRGKPIQQCASQLNIFFTLHGTMLGARSAFKSGYEEVNGLVAAQRMKEAEAKLMELSETGGWNLYEASRLWLLRSTFQVKEGDLTGAMRSIERATQGRGAYIEKDVYRSALVELFRLQAVTMHYRAAMDTYETIRKLKPPLENPNVERVAAEIRGAVESPQLLSFPGTVEYRSGCEEGRPNWKHELVRRKFAFDSIEGRIDDFQLRCDWKLVSSKVTTDQAWEVPKSWGACQVFVFGDVGAKVKLVEYPLAPPAAEHAPGAAAPATGL